MQTKCLIKKKLKEMTQIIKATILISIGSSTNAATAHKTSTDCCHVGILSSSNKSEMLAQELVGVNGANQSQAYIQIWLIRGQRHGTLEKNAATITFLAGEGDAYFNGQSLHIDGGLMR